MRVAHPRWERDVTVVRVIEYDETGAVVVPPGVEVLDAMVTLEQGEDDGS